MSDFLFRAYINCSSMVMEDLEGCMQLGVASSPYIHRVVIGVLCHTLIPMGIALQLPLQGSFSKSLTIPSHE